MTGSPGTGYRCAPGLLGSDHSLWLGPGTKVGYNEVLNSAIDIANRKTGLQDRKRRRLVQGTGTGKHKLSHEERKGRKR